jgi:sRNA-binding regulator protein Hfq
LIIQSRVIVFLALTLLIAWQPVAGQGLPGRSVSWQRVRDLKPGTTVEVMLKNGMSTKGRISSVSDNALSLDDDSRKLDFNRSEISRIDIFKHKVGEDTGKGMRIGYKITAPIRRIGGATCNERASCVLSDVVVVVAIVAFVPAGTAGGLIAGHDRFWSMK